MSDSLHIDDATQEYLNRIARRLLDNIGASRVNVRLRTTSEFPIVAEAVAEGIKAHIGMRFPGMVALPTFRFIHERRSPLIQDDTRKGEAAVVELHAKYGIISQVLWPIVIESDFLGFVAVHEVGDEGRVWSGADKREIEDAVMAVIDLVRRDALAN